MRPRYTAPTIPGRRTRTIQNARATPCTVSSSRPATALAAVLDLSGVLRLDVGGGSGAVSIAFARETLGLECTIWELPAVCELAQAFIEKAGMAQQVSTLAGDMFDDPFPEGFDAILFSQILHDWSPETCRTLLARAWQALPPGGR